METTTTTRADAEPTTTATSINPDANVWLFAGPKEPENRQGLYDVIKERNESRFGWGWEDGHDLRNFTWNDRSIYNRQRRLLHIKEGDYIVHVNTPTQGKVTVVRVKGEYGYHPSNVTMSGYRHYFPVEIVADAVDRSETDPHARLVARHRLEEKSESSRKAAFFRTLERFASGDASQTTKEKSNLFYLKENLHEELHKMIQKSHPGAKLEEFLVEVFRKVPRTTADLNTAKPQNGADIFVSYRNPFTDEEQSIVVQVNSFEGVHNDTSSIDQVAEAIAHFKADSGLLVATGDAGDELIEYANEKQEKLGKPINIITGADLSNFVLEYGSDLLY